MGRPHFVGEGKSIPQLLTITQRLIEEGDIKSLQAGTKDDHPLLRAVASEALGELMEEEQDIEMRKCG